MRSKDFLTPSQFAAITVDHLLHALNHVCALSNAARDKAIEEHIAKTADPERLRKMLAAAKGEI